MKKRLTESQARSSLQAQYGRNRNRPAGHEPIPRQMGENHLLGRLHQFPPCHPQIHSLCPLGGACNACPARVQTKLTINRPNDPYEQEADRAANQVMAMPEPKVQRACPSREDETVQTKALFQRQGDTSEKTEKPMQAKREGNTSPESTSGLNAQMRSLRGSGAPLPYSTRRFFEERFGRSLGDVRVHSGPRASDAAKAVRAQAFTLGRNIVFGSGRFEPETYRGKNLIAHELTHVIQQQGGFSDRWSHPAAGKASPAVQRRPQWPPTGYIPQPPPAKYSGLNPLLVEYLRKSYADHKGSNDYLHDAFHPHPNDSEMAYWPKTLWEGLDKFPLENLNAVTWVSEEMNAVGLWPALLPGHMRHAWWSVKPPSWGFAFDGPPTAEAFVISHPDFCRDFWIAERIVHAGDRCYRQIGKANQPGLHICFGQYPGIHIDPHQIADSKNNLPFPVPHPFNPLPVSTLVPPGGCFFNIPALVQHGIDYRTGRKSPFPALRSQRDQLKNLRKRLAYPHCPQPMDYFFQIRCDQLLHRIREDHLRSLAAKGSAGDRDAWKLYYDVDKDHLKIVQDESNLCKGPQAFLCVPPSRVAAATTFGSPRTASLRPDGASEGAAFFPIRSAPSELTGLAYNDGITYGTWERRPRVEDLQQHLILHGADLKADGMFGKNTLAALNQFQSRIGSPVQEVVDEETSAALEGSRPGTGGPAEISQLEGLKLNDGITYGTWERRPRVSNLQIRLTAFGFACKADGMFGPKTNEALHGFQTANGIPPSDAVDRPTADALEGGPGGGTECPSGYIPMPLELQHQRNGMTSA